MRGVWLDRLAGRRTAASKVRCPAGCVNGKRQFVVRRSTGDRRQRAQERHEIADVVDASCGRSWCRAAPGRDAGRRARRRSSRRWRGRSCASARCRHPGRARCSAREKCRTATPAPSRRPGAAGPSGPARHGKSRNRPPRKPGARGPDRQALSSIAPPPRRTRGRGAERNQAAVAPPGADDEAHEQTQ